METFVVRIWVPADGDGEPAGGSDGKLNGLLTHIGSGRVSSFNGHGQLLKLLVAGLQEGAGSEAGALPAGTLLNGADLDTLRVANR